MRLHPPTKTPATPAAARTEVLLVPDIPAAALSRTPRRSRARGGAERRFSTQSRRRLLLATTGGGAGVRTWAWPEAVGTERSKTFRGPR